MKINMTVEVSDAYRRAMKFRLGEPGMATRNEARAHIEMCITGDDESNVSDLPAAMQAKYDNNGMRVKRAKKVP